MCDPEKPSFLDEKVKLRAKWGSVECGDTSWDVFGQLRTTALVISIEERNRL